jgi:DNA repair protein RecN (Recombination protein N)
MLTELRVRDFAIIDALDVEFTNGLNVLTGETGAGKSIIVDAISLLLGDKAEANMVRAGCDRASIEGAFNFDRRKYVELDTLLKEHALEDDRPTASGDAASSELTLSREVRGNGRTVCRVNGRSISQQLLREVGELLMDVHGQSEHLSLLRVKEHINLLDRFAGLWELRSKVGAKVHELRAIRKQIEDIEKNARERARRVDMLKFQVEEIRNARLKANEEQSLSEEHTRLANAEELATYADEAHGALYESRRDHPAALDQIATALRAMGQLARFDKQFEEYHKSLTDANAVIEEVARTLRDYREAIEFNPRRLQQVEDRLEMLKKMKRKYGETIEAVIAFGEAAEQDLNQIEHGAELVEDLRKQEASLFKEINKVAGDLSKKRKAAAEVLANGVEQELQDLRMSGAKFKVDFQAQEPDFTGTDKVEFLIAPNMGEGLKPLAKVASGGETARLMLALKAVLSREGTHAPPTLIFDEIDTGIGGRVGGTVGHKLWGLTHTHQVLCITHLPQLAAFGDAHLKVEKVLHEGRTTTAVRSLSKKARVEEIAQMLGTTGKTGVQGAEQLLREAEEGKK